MEHAVIAPPPPAHKQMKLVLPVFALLLGLLALGYYMFVRTDYAVLYTELRPADAAAIVAELEEKGVPYKLRDGGTTILVSEDAADATRLGIAGSDAALKGSTGFELFNKSDMGLTDFAQKINYQRALQGELARTIMAMDGVQEARVHLAIPDRSLFRGNRTPPKAAVAVTWQRGRPVNHASVAGIQRLVAATVPELALSDVVVLDELGRVISPSSSPEAGPMDDRGALLQYYRARARAAVEKLLPGMEFDIRVTAPPAAGASLQNGYAASSATAAARDFPLHITMVTAARLNPADRTNAEQAISQAASLSPQGGDTIEFAIGPVTPPVAVPPTGDVPAVTIAPSPAPVVATPVGTAWPLGWILAVLAALGAAAAMLVVHRRASAVPLDERDEFVLRIRRQLSLEEEHADARA